MKKLRENKGITLIALIITIIVMLILVGVTVTVALNGGLFSTAKTASLDTRAETVREKAEEWKAIKEADKYTNDKKAQTLEELVNDLESQKMITAEEKETILTEGQVTIGTKTIVFETSDLSLLEEYCLGKVYTDVWDDQDTYKFKNNDVIPNAENDLEFLNMYQEGSGLYGFLYAKYSDKVYKISVEIKNETGICEKVELIYEPKGREGQTVAYDSNNDGTAEEWIILYDNGDNVEMVSKTNMGSLSLGRTDEQAQGSTDLDKAIYSYNNAIERINNYCTSLITSNDKISVRSIGSNPDNPSSENTTLYTSENLENWADGKYNGVGKSGDENAEQDIVRMSYYGCSATGESYWMASRCIYENSSDVYFYVDFMNSDGSYSGYRLWYVNSSGHAYGNNNSYGVRPVVRVSNI